MNDKRILARLKKTLGEMGLKEEASYLDRLMKKLAVPLEGFVPLDPYETMGYDLTRYELTDEDEDVKIITIEPPKLNRPNTILRDEKGRGSFTEDPDELSRWYDSIKNLGDSIILIPFDKTELDKNRKTLDGLAQIFGMDPPKDYMKLFDHSNLLDGFSNKVGDLNKLKKIFPSLWNDIWGVLKSKKLEEEEVVYMFYNQQNSPIRHRFTKDPFYFAHDLGHSAFDAAETATGYFDDKNKDFKFRGILKDFLSEAFKLYVADREIYIDKTGKEVGKWSEGCNVKIVTENILDKNSIEDLLWNENIFAKYLAHFFKAKSTITDIFGDIFAYAASGTLSDETKISDHIYIEEAGEFHLEPGKEGEVSRLLRECVDEINTYINPKGAEGGFSPGPFGHLRGRVVLQDV